MSLSNSDDNKPICKVIHPCDKDPQINMTSGNVTLDGGSIKGVEKSGTCSTTHVNQYFFVLIAQYRPVAKGALEGHHPAEDRVPPAEYNNNYNNTQICTRQCSVKTLETES